MHSGVMSARGGWPPGAREPLHDVLEYYTRYFRDDIVDLSSSSPHPTRFATRCGIAAGEDDATFVPPRGAREVRERIAARYRRASADDIVLANGASEALVAAANAVVSNCSTVAVERGVYPSFIEAARRNGAELSGAAGAPGATVIALCNPTVPGGQLHRRLPRAGTRRTVVVDESHLDIVYSSCTVDRAADVSPAHVSIGGFSKSLGYGGLRIGWAVTRSPRLVHSIDRQVQLLSGGPASPAIEAALSATDGMRERADLIHAVVRENAARVYRELDACGWTYRPAEAGLTVEATPPPGTPGGLDRVLYARGYFLVPCSVYGTAGSYRISLLAPVHHLRQALKGVS